MVWDKDVNYKNEYEKIHNSSHPQLERLDKTFKKLVNNHSICDKLQSEYHLINKQFVGEN